MSYIFNSSEWAWIARRADQIKLETGEPLPVARSTAMAQLACLRSMPKADVIPLDPQRRGVLKRDGNREDCEGR
jgi:hypothetical protein